MKILRSTWNIELENNQRYFINKRKKDFRRSSISYINIARINLRFILISISEMKLEKIPKDKRKKKKKKKKVHSKRKKKEKKNRKKNRKMK